MSDPVSALGGATFEGFASVREIGPLGMITLRAKSGTPGLAEAVQAATGCALPEQRRLLRQGDRAVGWMSPDEFLLILPYAEVASGLAAIAQALQGQHHLAVDVSDARAVFRIEGSKADQVLRKLSPVDFDRLEPNELRRSRAAQVAAAFWSEDGGFTLVCFRSVAGYVMGLLRTSAQPGSEL
ncbi:sarcosine oxidase subunit gamma [Pseudorhodobacter sp. MZDSW-24AT]|uniref:sarcosine oxidase subunit gamma n=1 Tax=Pseudorhodobacter sp. MZDSW-24AT TaxID=2052957 RepID=UPI000C1E7410|nr:sarcosine oxidase subunit gamma family protein [Pseudorhodobacter sp. MZDSW-24AT]PJF10574.1 sarcosine oxidase subunit gamma [Pseudorhodobacter sp. MZDSW-24AT]